MDVTPLLQKGFPEGFCPVPHWGYCFTGELHVKYKDATEEIIRGGDVFYLPPGHTMWVDKDAPEACEIIEFSEAAPFKAGEDLMAESETK